MHCGRMGQTLLTHRALEWGEGSGPEVACIASELASCYKIEGRIFQQPMPILSVCWSYQVLRKRQIVSQETAASCAEGTFGYHEEGTVSPEVGSAAGLCLPTPVTEECQKG